MGFGFDGSLVMPRNNQIRSADDALDTFNRVLASLLIGGIPVGQVDATNLAFGVLSTAGYYRYHKPHGPSGLLRQALGEGAAGGMLAIELVNPPVLQRETVEKAFERGEPTLKGLPSLRPEFLLISFSHFRRAEYRNALIYGWLVVEQLVGEIWKEIFLANMPSHLREARQANLRGIARNVSTKIEFLVDNNILDRKSYLHLSRARKCRNDLIHLGIEPAKKDVFFCLKGVCELIGIICVSKAIAYDPLTLLETIKDQPQGPNPHSEVTSNPDWSKSGFWRPVNPTPGEVHFSGNYEKIDEIRLLPLYRKDVE